MKLVVYKTNLIKLAELSKIKNDVIVLIKSNELDFLRLTENLKQQIFYKKPLRKYQKLINIKCNLSN